MGDVPACAISAAIGREAGLLRACYALRGNQPERRRRGSVFTVDGSIRRSDGALSELAIPWEPLGAGPVGRLFAVDATDCVTGLSRGRPDLDRADAGDFAFDQGDPESHCRNVYFTAMATYEAFRRALGRPVAWAFWSDAHHPPLRLAPFAQEALNAYYDRRRAEIGFGFAPAGAESHRADRRLKRFTALSSDVVAHEVTHALIDGLRPDYDMPVHPDVFAFHEALADVVALLTRFERPGYLAWLMRRKGLNFLGGKSLISLAPELGLLVRKSGLRTLDVDWTEVGDEGERPDPPRYADAGNEPHLRGGLLSSAVFEAFLRVLDRRVAPLMLLAAPAGSAVERYLLEQVQAAAARTAAHFLTICIRALDYCPPAAILFSDYLRALVTADSILVPDDRLGYREEIIDAFRRRGIYPDSIDVVSERELVWNAPEVPVYPIPGLALTELRYQATPVLPASAEEIRRQARALAFAIDADPRLARELGLRDPAALGPGARASAPEITSIRPALRIGPDGYVDFSVIAEIVQDREIAVDDRGYVRHRGGATLILDATGTPAMIVRQRIDNEERIAQETAYVREAVATRGLVLEGDRYVVDPGHRRALCS